MGTLLHPALDLQSSHEWSARPRRMSRRTELARPCNAGEYALQSSKVTLTGYRNRTLKRICGLARTRDNATGTRNHNNSSINKCSNNRISHKVKRKRRDVTKNMSIR